MPRTHRLLLVLATLACIPGAGFGWANSTSEPAQALIQLKPGVAETVLQPALRALGLRIERSLGEIDVVVVTGPGLILDRALAMLSAHPGIARVEPEVMLSAADTSPNDTHWPSQWGLRAAGFARAWDVARGSSETVVAVVDTGVERSHPDLRGGVLAGYDFVDDDADASDPHGHGTAVAGVLAARGNNLTGVAGACWHCRILPVRVLDAAGRTSSAVVAAGIIWAVDHGAKVINLSLGGDRSTIAEEGAVDYAARHDVVVVASAGNTGSTRRFYPAAHSDVIAVGASDPDDRLYTWSNRGEWVDVSAPGCNTALWRQGAYSIFCGTSSAAPLVAGVAALIRSANPRASAAETMRLVGDGRLDASNAFPRRRPDTVQRPRQPQGARLSLHELVRRTARRIR
jgi:subtilisin family serine protease